MPNSIAAELKPATAQSRFPMPFPFGWFCVAYSDELEVGQSMPFRVCGRDIVVFRTESGRAAALDAYCPHLGAHLGYGINDEAGGGGRIQGESIVCPFHAWRFNTDGECVEIPYAESMPKKVVGTRCLKSWPVCERNQVIYAWYHPQDLEPLWEVPEFEEANSDAWQPAERFEWSIHTHTQEMAENGADAPHLLYVHQAATMPEWDIRYEGHITEGINEMKMNTPRGEINGVIHNLSHGPGVNTTRFKGICETFLQGLPTPIEDNLVRIRFAFFQRKDDLGSGVAKALMQDLCKQMGEDKPIWEHKLYRPAPILCDGDGPIARFRKWYSQFYAETDTAA